MKKYALALNPDDFLYADAIHELFKTHASRIEMVCIFPSQSPTSSQREHLIANIRIVGLLKFIGIVLQWLMRRDRRTIREVSKDHGIACYDLPQVNSAEFFELLRSRQVSGVLNICSQIYKKQTLERLPPVYNFHGGYVPGNAGRFPIFWAKLKGFPQVVTCHQVTEVVDGGTPILHFLVPTEPRNTIWEITVKITSLFPEIIRRSIQLIDEGKRETLSIQIPEFYGPRPSKKDVALYRAQLRG